MMLLGGHVFDTANFSSYLLDHDGFKWVLMLRDQQELENSTNAIINNILKQRMHAVVVIVDVAEVAAIGSTPRSMLYDRLYDLSENDARIEADAKNMTEGINLMIEHLQTHVDKETGRTLKRAVVVVMKNFEYCYKCKDIETSDYIFLRYIIGYLFITSNMSIYDIEVALNGTRDSILAPMLATIVKEGDRLFPLYQIENACKMVQSYNNTPGPTE